MIREKKRRNQGGLDCGKTSRSPNEQSCTAGITPDVGILHADNRAAAKPLWCTVDRGWLGSRWRGSAEKEQDAITSPRTLDKSGSCKHKHVESRPERPRLHQPTRMLGEQTPPFGAKGAAAASRALAKHDPAGGPGGGGAGEGQAGLPHPFLTRLGEQAHLCQTSRLDSGRLPAREGNGGTAYFLVSIPDILLSTPSATLLWSRPPPLRGSISTMVTAE